MMKYLPENVSFTTVQIISDIVNRRGFFSRDKLIGVVSEEIERLWPEESWEDEAKRAGLATTKQIRTAIDAYWLAVAEKRIAPNPPHTTTISNGAISMIEEVAGKAATMDRMDILEAVCEDLQARFSGDSLEYHLCQMNISTTSDLLYAIDLYKAERDYERYNKLA